MAEHRPFPPSPRRRALARRAGLHAASPVVTGAVACAAALVAAVALGRSGAARLGAWIAAACRGDAAIAPRDAAAAVLELALPIAAAAAIAAAIAHLAQTRAAWLPRHRIAGAPTIDRGPGARTARAAGELAAAAVVGSVAVGWLWLAAPRLAALPDVPLAGAALLASAVAAIAIAWAVLGALDALLRHRELAHALRMSPQDQREDQRLSGADPRWRRLRADLARGSSGPRPDPSDAIAGATVLILGEVFPAPAGPPSGIVSPSSSTRPSLAVSPASARPSGIVSPSSSTRPSLAVSPASARPTLVAVAIAWDPVRRPVPIRTAVGRDARATQLVALARRHRIPIHRDALLATSLAEADGAVPETHWPRLAEIVAAVRRS